VSDQESGISVDTTVAHPARRYDYLLGGKDNFAADRESGERLIATFPTMRTAVLENRRFMRRTVTHLAERAGIRQFLDIGTGIPTSPNAHEIAQGIAPESRVVYADNDPVVLVHARALLTSTPEGATAYLDADLREPEKILAHPELRRTLDLSQPVALMLIAVLHFIPDAGNPHGLVEPLIRALVPGSYVVLSHATHDFLSPQSSDRIRAEEVHTRSKEEFLTFFDGLELLEPGVVSVSEWRAETEPQPRPAVADVSWYGGVARIS
jgi:hypothetical protein